MNKKCENCLYYACVKYRSEKIFEECRRFPPQMSLDCCDAPFTDFPEVKKHWWCGEFKPKE